MNFYDLARIHGLELPDLYPSERVQRCGTQKHPRSKDGAYFWDGRRGWVSDWSNGGEIYWFDDPKAKDWTGEERRDWAKRKMAKEHAQRLAWRAAAERAQELLNIAKPATHYYLNAKGLPDALGLVVDTALLVPMRNFETNQLQGVQVIDWNSEERHYTKKMNYGMRAKGSVLRLGHVKAKETFLCEGYATGLSIEIAVKRLRLNASVLVCFSDSNLAYIGSQVKGPAFVFADNDVSGAGERAAVKTSLPYCMSPQVAEDANDCHQRAGLMALCSLIMNVRMMKAVQTA